RHISVLQTRNWIETLERVAAGIGVTVGARLAPSTSWARNCPPTSRIAGGEMVTGHQGPRREVPLLFVDPSIPQPTTRLACRRNTAKPDGLITGLPISQT